MPNLNRILTLVKDAIVPAQCVVCGNLILGPCYRDGLGNMVCMQHKDVAAHCLSCGRLCSKEKANHIGLGQYVCETCTAHTPMESDIPKISDYVKKVLSDAGISDIPTFTLHLVEIEELKKVIGRVCEGYASYDGIHYSIHVLKHLSRTCYASVLAHEMLHLWQMKLHLKPKQDICEGFCNLGSYEVLKAIGTPVARNRMTGLENDHDPIYGDGFRKVKKVYDAKGWAGVITKIKKYK